MDFLSNYLLFLLKTLTIVLALLVVILPIIFLGQKDKQEKGKLEIKYVNDQYKILLRKLKQAILTKEAFKQLMKAEKKQEKQKEKAKAENTKKKKIFILTFEGDIKASHTPALIETINAVLSVATPSDEIFVHLESHGGMVHAYGLASAQLHRIRQANIPLTIAVDKVAASGGYMMACVANKILASPFAILGSIGVLAQLPNFHRLMKKNHIDYEQITAGEFKRTLTIFGENTAAGRQKFQQQVEETHTLFKAFIQKNRPQVNIDQVATGEYWLAEKAKELNLVDELMTADDYLLNQLSQADLYEVNYVIKKSLSEKFGLFTQAVLDRLLATLGRKESETEWM